MDEVLVEKLKNATRNMIDKANAILKELDGFDKLFVSEDYINEKNDIIRSESDFIKSYVGGEDNE